MRIYYDTSLPTSLRLPAYAVMTSGDLSISNAVARAIASRNGLSVMALQHDAIDWRFPIFALVVGRPGKGAVFRLTFKILGTSGKR